MAPIMKKWLWLPLIGISVILVLTVHPDSKWMAALIITPGMVGILLRVRTRYIETQAHIKKLRSDA
jgi:hypothetical protein